MSNINVCYCSSELYSDCLIVSVYSLLKSQSSQTRVFVLSDGLSDLSKNRLHSLATAFNQTISIIDVSQKLYQVCTELGFKTMRGSYSTFARICLPCLLPNTNNVIFLDSDTLICRPLDDLWEIDIGQKTIGMVPEMLVYLKNNHFEDPRLVKSVPLYYNAGICLFNLKRWQTINLSKRITDYFAKPNSIPLANDQSVINYLFNDEIFQIPACFNYYTPLHEFSKSQFERFSVKRNLFSEEELDIAKRAPSIIHFYGMPFDRPWYAKSVSPYKQRYRSLAKEVLGQSFKLRKWPNNPNHFFKFYDKLTYFVKKTTTRRFYCWFHYVFSQKIKEKLGFDRKKLG